MISHMINPFRTARFLSILKASLLAWVLSLTTVSGFAATVQTIASSTAQEANAASGHTTEQGAPLDESAVGNSNVTLSAAQILSILQRDPEVIIELKSVIAEASQQTGTPLQADAITDEMIYGQIMTSSDLRATITTFLRARGYVADADQQDAGAAQSNSVDRTGTTRAQLDASMPMDSGPRLESLAPMTGLNDTQRPSGEARIPEQPSSIDRNLENSKSEPEVLRRPAPYNLLSLRDLYTQVPATHEALRRFGSDVFLARDLTAAVRAGISSSTPPLEIPVRPDYVLGPGDSLTINLWGGVTQTLNRVIDRNGEIMLPEAGETRLAGLTLDQAQATVEGALKQQFRDAHVGISVAKLRTMRIYVVGDVQRPGAYDLSSLSSPLGALYAAGGPTAVGSLRVLRHIRQGKPIGEMDLYDFLLRGVQAQDDRLESGDTLLVPAAGPQVAVQGAVKRPAIYELLHETSLDVLLEEAGGITVAADLSRIKVERIDTNQQRETVSLGVSSSEPLDVVRAAVAAFKVQDDDRVWVAPILAYSTSVIYLEGHVARPGRFPYHDGMRLNDVLRSYGDLLPEPAAQGEIVRLVPPDLHAETVNFSVPEVLIGNDNPPLRPFDTVRVFGRYEQDPPNVTVHGEVLRPGTYALSEGMSAAQLIRMAGGFKRDALTTTADLASYQVLDGDRIERVRRDLRIGDAVLKGDRDADADATLKPGDVLTVHQITGWDDIGASIIIEGEIAHPGCYGFQQGEHLSDLLRRAGGFRETAYPEGAVLTRPEIRVLEEKSREELIRQIETSSAAARLSPNIAGGDQSGTLQLIQQQQEQVLSRLRSQPATGRLVIRMTSDIDSWAGSAADIEVRSGDVLRVPKRPGFILITGQVYNSAAISFAPQKTAGWYLQRAGGATGIANRKEIFIIRANGSVIGRHSGEWYDRDVLSTRLDPGDVIVVPQKIVGASLVWRNLLSAAQIAASIAITAAVAGL